MEDDFDFINCNFPPDPAPIEEVNGKLVCDLTCYEAPTEFPSNILSQQNLQVLKLFTDNLLSVPDGIGNLKLLRQLVLCHFENHTHNHITKLPVSLKYLQQLELLDLRNNPLSKFPTQLTTLTNLEELHINNCRLSSLPEKLDQLHSLKVLDLSNNLFTTLPLCITRLQNLVKLYMSDGMLESLCPEIKNLRKLERLQLTNNKLASLPDDFFELINLKKLRLNANQLTMLADKVGNLVRLKYLVLNRNKLAKLPHTIGNLKDLQYLNLHENRLTRLPETITSLAKLETLHAENNPLQVPPIYVCNQGLPSICNYFQAMRNTGNIHSKRLKVFLLGESMAGKTSLVNALVQGEAVEISKDDRTFGADFYHWKPEPDVDELKLLVVDCAGQRKYQMTHQLFLSEGALFLLAVNLSTYKFDDQECFCTAVGEWITLVAARIPRARILVVPTHVDEVTVQEEINLKCNDIVTKIKKQQLEMVEEIDRKISYVRKTQGSCTPVEDLNKLLEEHQIKKDNLPVISLQYQEETSGENQYQEGNLSMNVIPVSNIGSLQGMIELRKELVRIARNRSLSPSVDRELPESWMKLESTMKELAKTMDIPCVSIAEFHELLKEHNIDIPNSELDCCLSYLHAIGELLYFREISDLVKKVVLNPYWLVSVLKRVFRHDLAETLVYSKCCRMVGIPPFQFEQDKKELLNSGIMTEMLLKCIWIDLVSPSNDIFSQLLTMLTHFGLACEMPSVANDLDHSNGIQPRCYLMPWFFSSKCPGTLDGNWSSVRNKNQVEVTAGFALLQYLPYGVFERFSVRCHRHEPEDFEHWHNGLFMKFGDVMVHGNVSTVQGCATLMLAARAPNVKLDELWRTLLILLKEVQKLLQEWPGMNFVCFTVCPECTLLGERQPYQFTCDWFRDRKNKKHKLAVCKNKVNATTHNVDLKYLFPSAEVLRGYQNPEYHPASPFDIVLPERLLDDIAEKLGTKWPKLARKLGVGDKVDSIKGDDPGNTDEQAVQMLYKWRRKNGDNAQISVLIEALQELEFNEIVDLIKKEICSSKN